MRRRELIIMLGGAAVAWPVAPRAQQKAMPVIGVLGLATPNTGALPANLSALREGLRETGYTEGQNFHIEYRWAEGHADQLPALAADLVARKVDVIVTEGGDASSLAAKSATSTIPIVFHSSSDPVAIGLIASLARPGSNLTGVSLMSAQLIPKLLEQLLELVPRARVIALWVDPDEPWTERVIGQMQEAARAKRVDLHVLKAHTESETDAAFATLVQAQPDGLVLGPVGPIRRQIAALALRHAVPAIDWQRAFADAGGLVSYGPSLTAVYHLKGIYAGKILKGAKPAELPVQQPTTFNLFINIRTAKALGLDLPQSLLARADEIIE
jgi:putative ABC transport system substrate-binding protein